MKFVTRNVLRSSGGDTMYEDLVVAVDPVFTYIVNTETPGAPMLGCSDFAWYPATHYSLHVWVKKETRHSWYVQPLRAIVSETLVDLEEGLKTIIEHGGGPRLSLFLSDLNSLHIEIEDLKKQLDQKDATIQDLASKAGMLNEMQTTIDQLKSHSKDLEELADEKISLAERKQTELNEKDWRIEAIGKAYRTIRVALNRVESAMDDVRLGLEGPENELISSR